MVEAIPAARGSRSRPVVPRVLPEARDSVQGPFCRRGSVPVWSAQAGGTPSEGGRSAEHAYAADRCAHEIVGFLTVFLGRARGG